MHKLTVITKAQNPYIVEAAQDGRLIDVLRSLPGESGPLLAWRCGQGTCGACVVRLDFAPDIVPSPRGRMEHNVLIRRGLLPSPLPGRDDGTDGPTGGATATDEAALKAPRLACHVRVTGDLLVYIENN
ncbi:2Fe-2S iron-sulfur cluster-binding protein [Chitiniphilus shinanonensis]|uniref:2Fe-2S iron-sulfur cluster-binding protein n=1 Tax=Chitiniphilus shinanonensis TaxID=553088 RepID=UPI00304B9965